MTIPNLPTDNLYKFVSLTGVVLALVCFGVLEYRISKQVKLDTEISLGKEAFGYFERKLERISTTAKTDLKAVKAKEDKDEEIKKSEIEEASLALSQYKELKSRIDNFDQEIMALRHKSEIAENHHQRTLRIRPLMLFGGFFGIALSCAGFYFWYYRLQKYQDMLLQNQAIGTAQQVAQADAEDSTA